MLTGEEVGAAYLNRQEWRQSVAQCMNKNQGQRNGYLGKFFDCVMCFEY